MKKILHKSDTRGLADHGWLHSRHTFSFAQYHDPNRMGFGVLRVVNDDIVQPGMGFGTHTHANMEIVSIPLAGSLLHQDSMGNKQLIKQGEIQVMSAGTGVSHSEYNASETELVNFLQIWVLPETQDLEPRYGQKKFASRDRQNRFQVVVSPVEEDSSVWINQGAWFLLGDFNAGMSGEYSIRQNGNGAYFFLLEGSINIVGEQLESRDGIGVTDVEKVMFDATEDSQILVMDVPLA